MRTIKSLDDAQKVINELLDWKSRLENSSWDLKGYRITGAGEGKDPQDYATVSQIPIIEPLDPAIKDLDYTIVWSKDGVVSETDIIPAFIVLKGREGKPHQMAIYARTDGDLTVSLWVKQLGFAAVNFGTITLDINPDVKSRFEIPTNTLGYQHVVYPVIDSVSGAESVTIELTVRRFRDKNFQ